MSNQPEYERVAEARQCYETHGIDETLIVYGTTTTAQALRELLPETQTLEDYVRVRLEQAVVEHIDADEKEMRK